MKKNYSEILKQAIRDGKYKQKDIAEKCGISESVLSRLIKKDIVDIDNLIAVCRELKISASSIISEPETEQEFIQLFRKLNAEQQPV